LTAKAYIESGAIETCVKGLANAGELELQRRMEDLYPEVKAERARLEEAISNKNASGQPETATEGTPQPGAKPNVVTGAPKPVRWLRGTLAALVLLLMGSVLLNFYYYGLFASLRRQYNALVVQQNNTLAQNVQLKDDMKMILSPEMKHVDMSAAGNDGKASCTVFWNSRTGDVYLRINQLPPSGPNKQYQLWATAGTSTVNAGLLDLNSPAILRRMKNVPAAQAFAITLENTGGSQAPNMETMIVSGKL
jgi:Anti-sigma-K factor rskA